MFLNMLGSLSLRISPICYLNLAGESAGIPQVVFLGMAPEHAQAGGIWGNILLLHVLIGSWVYSLYERGQQFKNRHEDGPQS